MNSYSTNVVFNFRKLRALMKIVGFIKYSVLLVIFSRGTVRPDSLTSAEPDAACLLSIESAVNVILHGTEMSVRQTCPLVNEIYI